MAPPPSRLLVCACALFLGACNDDSTPRLQPVADCESHDECVEADERYDQCAWVCEGHITYCQVSCEVDADCEGRGLPPEYEFCDIPRPGEGFCNKYNFDYADDACQPQVPELPDVVP